MADRRRRRRQDSNDSVVESEDEGLEEDGDGQPIPRAAGRDYYQISVVVLWRPWRRLVPLTTPSVAFSCSLPLLRPAWSLRRRNGRRRISSRNSSTNSSNSLQLTKLFQPTSANKISLLSNNRHAPHIPSQISPIPACPIIFVPTLIILI